MSLNPNPIENFLRKPSKDFTRADLIRFCEKNNVEMINLRYCGWDGRLKTLNFVIQGKDHLESVLSAGERVDGSSLFPFVEAGKSDLYVIPRYSTAFMDPFEEVPTLSLLCSFFGRDAKPFESSPEYTLKKAAKVFTERTGLEMQAMAELEYYIISEEEDLYKVEDQKGYHESTPYNKFTEFRTEAMRLIASCGGKVKYGHSEVGNFTMDSLNYEQNEIEFLPVPVCEAADQIVVAKWIMTKLAYEYGVELSFAPKIAAGKAGSGMHVHVKFTRDGKSVMTCSGAKAFGENGGACADGEVGISEECRKAIAGFIDAGTSLPAFGNPSPVSYQRLVPHQEAPTSLCWSFSNRSALVRVPLGWTSKVDMAGAVNPLDAKKGGVDFSDKQTFEWRASDATADTYLLMAALCCAARHGFEMDAALEVADRTYVGLGVNIHDAANAELCESLQQLPASCAEAAACLEKSRSIYTSSGVFADTLVDFYISLLSGFNEKR